MEGTRTGVVIINIPVFGLPPVISHSSDSSKSNEGGDCDANVWERSFSLVAKGEDDAGGDDISEETNVYCISIRRSDACF